MAYVYRHIRLDKNEPFYIGVGEDIEEEIGKYRRAHTKVGRNSLWINVASKTKYEIEILVDQISYKKALEKEIEFIALYGRKNIGKGPLCNLTDGGEGTRGYKFSENSLNIIRKRIEKTRKRIIQKDVNGDIVKIWDSMTEAIKSNPKFNSSGIGMCCNNRMKTHQGFKWQFENPNHITRKGKENFREYKKVIQIDPKSNMAVKVWQNADKAETIGFYPEYITACCKGKYKERYGYKWEYFDEKKEYKFDENHEIQDNQKRKYKRKVVQIDPKTNEILAIFNSTAHAEKFGFRAAGIWQCLKKKNNCEIHKGYKWEYLHKL